jgi:hypothetical protein
MEISFLKWMNPKKLQSSVQSLWQLHLLMNDGDHRVNADCDPDLSLHGVGTFSIVMFDAQVPFEPTEEELDPASQTVNGCNSQRRNVQVVGQENQIEKLGQHESAGIHAKKHEWISNASHHLFSIKHSYYFACDTSSLS